MSTPTISLIISTYNWPEALELCLQSVKRQTTLPDQVVIADDGSREETRKVVERFQKELPVPLVHVWHEDNGFRLTVIRNKAFAQCTCDYIVQVDGDLILHKEFINDHKTFAQKGSYVSGSRVKLTKEYSEQLQKKEKPIEQVSVWRKGTKNFLNGLHLPCLSSLFEYHNKKKLYYVRGCNMAFWKEDLLRVNGYNEDIVGWGREDNEIACRLENLGKQRRILKFAGIVFHQFHEERSRERLDENDDLLHKTIESKTIYCPNGMDKYISTKA